MKWADATRKLTSTTARLTGTYVLIIMLMSIGFSIVFYNISSRQLGRQIPPPSFYAETINDEMGTRIIHGQHSIDSFLQERIDEGRQELLYRLIWLNVLALVGGTALSYYLARRTLEPIEAAMEAQSQFVSDASHELRTPLTALQTMNEVALRKPKLSPKETRELIEYNVAEAVKLKALSDALLGLLKHDSRPEKPIAISLQDVTADAMNEVVQLALDKKIAVQDDVPAIFVLANRIPMTQVITILLDNAIKYSPHGTTVYVSASKKGKYAYLQIKDQGIGIKASDLPHIFRRFYRADKSRTSQETSGYGLGLAIAQKIILQYHGTIHVESTPSAGTTFTVKLPLAQL